MKSKKQKTILQENTVNEIQEINPMDELLIGALMKNKTVAYRSLNAESHFF